MAENMEAEANPQESQPTSSNLGSTELDPSLEVNELTQDLPNKDITSPAPMEETARHSTAEDVVAVTDASETTAVTSEQCLSHSKTSMDTVHFNKNEIVSDTRANKLWIVCSVCKCKILQPNAGMYVEKDADLPPLLKKDSIDSSSSSQEIPVERVSEFWKIKDMFHFENIGVSKTIGTTKYLLCADCEIGPVGYHLTTNAQEFLLAAGRVMYATSL